MTDAVQRINAGIKLILTYKRNYQLKEANMFYCDKCRNHLAVRHIHGCNHDHSFGPFALDLCTRCYNEFRTTVHKWTANNVWAEADSHAHADENIGKI